MKTHNNNTHSRLCLTPKVGQTISIGDIGTCTVTSVTGGKAELMFQMPRSVSIYAHKEKQVDMQSFGLV